jgi:hypothetical protein
VVRTEYTKRPSKAGSRPCTAAQCRSALSALSALASALASVGMVMFISMGQAASLS